jgi:hypothetical protein
VQRGDSNVPLLMAQLHGDAAAELLPAVEEEEGAAAVAAGRVSSMPDGPAAVKQEPAMHRAPSSIGAGDASQAATPAEAVFMPPPARPAAPTTRQQLPSKSHKAVATGGAVACPLASAGSLLPSPPHPAQSPRKTRFPPSCCRRERRVHLPLPRRDAPPPHRPLRGSLLGQQLCAPQRGERPCSAFPWPSYQLWPALPPVQQLAAFALCLVVSLFGFTEMRGAARVKARASQAAASPSPAPHDAHTHFHLLLLCAFSEEGRAQPWAAGLPWGLRERS